MKTMVRADASLGLIVLSAAVTGVHAQQLEPRSFTNTPVGLNFLIAGYGYTQGTVGFDPAVPIEGAQLRTDSLVIGYVRSLNVRGRSGKFDVVLPYTDLAGSALVQGQPKQRAVSGSGDPIFEFSANFYGAPALSLKEFAHYRQDLVIGAKLRVTAPLGQYDASKLVNIGSNRWSFKPELGLSKTWGLWTVELAAGVTAYTANTNFFNGGTLTQAPLYSLQGHLIYSLNSGIWMALDGTLYRGGFTTVDGVTGDTLQEATRTGLTIALPVNRYHSIKLHGSTGTSSRTGSHYNALTILWQYRWGGGY